MCISLNFYLALIFNLTFHLILHISLHILLPLTSSPALVIYNGI